jgi:hypothetical protein
LRASLHTHILEKSNSKHICLRREYKKRDTLYLFIDLQNEKFVWPNAVCICMKITKTRDAKCSKWAKDYFGFNCFEVNVTSSSSLSIIQLTFSNETSTIFSIFQPLYLLKVDLTVEIDLYIYYVQSMFLITWIMLIYFCIHCRSKQRKMMQFRNI